MGPCCWSYSKTLPANDLAALVAWLKANPDKASAGTGGIDRRRGAFPASSSRR